MTLTRSSTRRPVGGERAAWQGIHRRPRVQAGSRTFAVLLFGLAPLYVAGLGLASPAARPALAVLDARAEQKLRGVEERTLEVAASAVRATVGIQVGPNMGSGVIVSRDGLVLTAGHVIEAPGRRARVTLSDGRVVDAVTLGVNRWIDSGMVRIEERGDWPFLEMGSSSDLEPGDWVLALGHPGGVEVGRPPVVRLGRVDSRDARVVRTDCTIVSGDSGGPLVDLDGRVVGIHTSLRPVLVANDHLPIDTFLRTWEMLASGEAWGGGALGRAYLGVDGRTHARGVTLAGVEEGLPADLAGLERGDLVLALDGVPFSGGIAELEQRVSELRVGESATFTIERAGVQSEVDVALLPFHGDRPVRIVDTPRASFSRSKIDRGLRSAFQDAALAASHSTLEVLCRGRRVALGTVVDAGGFLVTKASELTGPVICRIDGRPLEAQIVAVDSEYDLALLRVDAKLELAPFADVEIEPGRIVVTPDARSLPLSLGVVGTPVRAIAPQRGYLGIRLGDLLGEARVDEVMAASAADRAGLRSGDVILRVDERLVRDARGAIEAIRARRPGSEIVVAFRRDEVEGVLSATLGAHPFDEGAQAALQDQQAGPLSRIRSGFPSAIQHDSVLRPEDCGGPLIDTQGRVVGVNLARAGRSASYAIPTRDLVELVDRLKSTELR